MAKLNLHIPACRDFNPQPLIDLEDIWFFGAMRSLRNLAKQGNQVPHSPRSLLAKETLDDTWMEYPNSIQTATGLGTKVAILKLHAI